MQIMHLFIWSEIHEYGVKYTNGGEPNLVINTSLDIFSLKFIFCYFDIFSFLVIHVYINYILQS